MKQAFFNPVKIENGDTLTVTWTINDKEINEHG